jgi:hypothetical protein
VYAQTGSGLFVTKLNAAGNALVYSTFLQSAGAKPSAIRLDASGNVVVVGQTTDTIPATGSAFQASNPSVGIGSGFVIKLNTTGSGLMFATYLGGSAEDNARGVALDPAGNIYVAGHTKNLSVNYVNVCRYFAEGNDGGGKVVERHEAALEFFVAHQQLAEAVEPTVADLDHPAPRLLLRVTPLEVGFLAPAHDVGDVAVLLDCAKVLCAAVSRISA